MVKVVIDGKEYEGSKVEIQNKDACSISYPYMDTKINNTITMNKYNSI